MPTLGWRQENDTDSRMAQTERVPDPTPAKPIPFFCPFCVFSSPELSPLQNHIADQHAVDRPFVLHNGKELSQQRVFRTAPGAGAITVVNAARALTSLDGQAAVSLTPTELTKALTTKTSGQMRFKLLGHAQKGLKHSETEYEVTFFIPTAAEISRVEKIFMSEIASQPLSMPALDRFLQHEACNGAARNFARGLAEYVAGILIKEGTTDYVSTVSYSTHRDRYGAALEALSSYPSRLATLISDVIRFTRNEFDLACALTGCLELDTANSMLKRHELPRPRNANFQSAGQKIACPIDHVTHQLLSTAIHLYTQNRWSKSLDDFCRNLITSSSWDDADRQKLCAFWALTALDHGAKASAVEPLRQIRAIYPFSTWADNYLDMVMK